MGYQLEVKVRPSLQDDRSRQEAGAEALVVVTDRVKRLFPGAWQIESFGDRATYSVPRDSVPSLARAFGELEKSKRSDFNSNWRNFMCS